MHRSAPTLGLLTSPVRREILDLLSNLPATSSDPGQPTRSDGLSAAGLAELLTLHVTTVRFHVDQMIDAGLLVAHDVRVGVGRPRRYYAVNPNRNSTPATGAEGQRAVTEILAEALLQAQAGGPVPSTVEAAHRWVLRHRAELLGERAAASPAVNARPHPDRLRALVELLERWGYTPTARPSALSCVSEIEVTRCPVRRLALRHPALAVDLLRGLLTGSLAALRQRADVDLRPLGDPERVLVRIRWAAAASRQPAAASA